MKYEMTMPDLATTDSAIKVVRWLRQPGQPVRRGELLLEIETDKSAMEVECPVDGVLRGACVAPGEETHAGAAIAWFDLAEPAPAPSGPSVVAPTEPAGAAETAPTAPPPAKAGGLFSRNRAARTTPVAPGADDPSLALSPAQRTAARRLQESKQQVPHFYLQSSASARSLIARRQLATPAPAWDAFFVHALSRVLPRFSRLACRYDDGRLIPQGTTTIGIAADIDGSLHVVPIEAPQGKSVDEISNDLRRTVAGLRAGDPAFQRLVPGVMTVSNLGGSHVEAFSAIINPPEAAILAVGAIRDTVVTCAGAIAVEPRVTLTLSVDHRVTSGKYAAGFLAALVAEIEHPA